jgi:hypothetical protein
MLTDISPAAGEYKDRVTNLITYFFPRNIIVEPMHEALADGKCKNRSRVSNLIIHFS